MPIPPNNRVVGNSNHVEDHNAISDVLTEHETRVDGLEATVPQFVGSVASEATLPSTGEPGQLYFVGQEGDVYGYDSSSTPKPWSFLTNLRGEPGALGEPGTIVGVLAAGANPPGGTAAGTLWFQLDSGAPPPPDVTASFIGSSANFSNNQNCTITKPPLTQAGDICILYVAQASTTAPTDPSGWTLVDSRATANARFLVYSRVAQAGDTSVNFVGAGTGKSAGTMMTFRGVTLDGSGLPHKIAFSNPTGATPAAPSVVPTVASIIVSFWGERQGTGTGAFTLGVPATIGMTAADDGGLSDSTGGSVMSVKGAYDLDEVSSGTIAPGTWSRSGTAGSQLTCHTLALAVV